MMPMTQTPAAASALSPFQRSLLTLVAILVVAVIALAIVVAVTARNAEVDRKKAECERWQSGSIDYYLCLSEADD